MVATLFGSTMRKIGYSFFTPAYHLMVMIQGNNVKNMIVLQLFENFSNTSTKIAELELFLKSTCALMKSCIPQEMKLLPHHFVMIL